MERATKIAFFEELQEIAAGADHVSPAIEKMKLAAKALKEQVSKEVPAVSPVAKELNAAFGLPLKPKGKQPKYETGPSAALSGDRSQHPVAGMATPNISSSNVMSPAYGPGGV
jgi:hypothetical protein